MSMDIQREESENVLRPAVLIVDDEENILNSMKRLFVPLKYTIITALNANEGLEKLQKTPVDVVISDIKMPGMNGIEFLNIVKDKYPGTFRIVLTAYAEVGLAIESINRTHIYQLVTKPWEDNELLMVVRNAVERKQIEREKKVLENKIKEQNDQLRNFNALLEAKVAEQTRDIKAALKELEISHDKLKKSYFTTIQVFSNLIELRQTAIVGHSRRVAAMSRNIALRYYKDKEMAQTVAFAALLHDIGKIGWPDDLLEKSFVTLTAKEKAEYIKHPSLGQAALLPLEYLAEPSALIRSHHEKYNGTGYPDHLIGDEIPVGARILAVCNDFDTLQTGKLLKECFSRQQAIEYIVENKGKRYDPEIVDEFLMEMSSSSEQLGDMRELIMDSPSLRSGMVLSRDLYSVNNLLLLSKDQVLKESTIDLLRTFERMEDKQLIYFIKKQRGG